MDPIGVRVIRGDTVESVHRVSVAVADPKGRLVASFGNATLVTFLRSAAKPFQLIPLIETGAADHYQFPPKELAIMAGSHNGEPDHVRTVEAILSRIGLGPEALQCGRHAPYHKETAEQVGPNFTSLHHNCSGKHAGMLALARHNGWDAATYLAPENPVQAKILDAVAKECGLGADQVATGIDGCGVVNFAVPLRNSARAFARLASPESVRGRRGTTLRRIRDAMVANPGMVAGTDRLDTDLMVAMKGRILVKAGAEACYGAGVMDQGLGICIKVEDGNARAVGPVLVRVLEGLGKIDDGEKRAVEKHWNEPIRNVAGRVVGRIECLFELRRPRRRVAASAV